jgi:hypothetical protein
MIKGIVADKFDVDAYPQEPVQEIRDMLQVFEAANEYYTQIFKKEEIGSKVAPDFGLQIKALELRGYIEEYEDIIQNLQAKVDQQLYCLHYVCIFIVFDKPGLIFIFIGGRYTSNFSPWRSPSCTLDGRSELRDLQV